MGLTDYGSQNDEDVFVGQVIGHPDFVEAMLGHGFFGVGGHFWGGAGWIELNTKAHGGFGECGW